MKNDKLPETIGLFVSLCGILVMAGWFLNIGVLKSILPFWVTMKFSTALSFFLSGIILYYIARFQKGDKEVAGIIIPAASMIVALLMTSLLVSIFGIIVGIEEMFVKEAGPAVKTFVPGRPALATIVNFILIAVTGLMINYNISKSKAVLTGAGIIVGSIGAIAVFGYIINQPIFYFMVPGMSGAMALHTAILFVLLGLGLLSARCK